MVKGENETSNVALEANGQSEEENGREPDPIGLPDSNGQSDATNGTEDENADVNVSLNFGCNYANELRNGENPDRPEFSYETDHEALRGNKDYLAAMRTLAVLQAQKIQAVKDLETLIEAKNEALKDPLQMIEKLQRGEDLKLPGKQHVAQLPPVDWSKYGLSRLSQSSVVHEPSSYPTTRETRNSEDITKTRHHEEHGALQEVKGLGCKVEKTPEGQYLVRGRLFDGKKPKTFNQPWTAEEQKRLEELLHEFPSEEVEMERWKKIANRLGNRTAIQVQSRTQKYFLKLHKAGLPIPGRLGKQARHTKRHASHPASGMANFNKGAVNQFINNRQMYSTSLIGQRHSTFFPHLKPDVTMTDDELRIAADHPDTAASGFWSLNQDLHHSVEDKKGDGDGKDFDVEMDDVSDEEGVPDDLKTSDDYQELLWLKRIRREKELEQREGNGQPVTHLGFKCDGCAQDPIVGPRFTCVDCLKSDRSIDLCVHCAPQRPNIGLDAGHKPCHALRPVRKREKPEPQRDQDYLIKSSRESYLDPNYHYFK